MEEVHILNKREFQIVVGTLTLRFKNEIRMHHDMLCD